MYWASSITIYVDRYSEWMKEGRKEGNKTRLMIFSLPIWGADVGEKSGVTGTTFRYPSYVQDIMGDIFSLGFGPFRYITKNVAL